MGAMVKKNETEEVIISELLLAANKYNIFGWIFKFKLCFAIFNKLGELTKHIQQIHPIPF